MTASLTSAPGVYLATVDDDIIVLDVVKDAYECLFNSRALVTVEADGRILASDGAVRNALIQSGIAVEVAAAASRREIEPARRELPVDPQPPLIDVLRAAIVLASAALRFRGRTLLDLISTRHAVRGPAQGSEARLAQLAGAARIARTWIPFEGECLKRSYKLKAYLASQGVQTDWIFGVRTWPFAAHCWLQIGDLLVGDRLERTSRFTPILRA